MFNATYHFDCNSDIICINIKYCYLKLQQAILVEGHLRNIPVKLFENPSIGLREEDHVSFSLLKTGVALYKED